jgi:hypothetical protein
MSGIVQPRLPYIFSYGDDLAKLQIYTNPLEILLCHN